MKKTRIFYSAWFTGIFLLWAFGIRENRRAITNFFFGTPHTTPNRYVVAPGEYVNSLIDNTTGLMYEFQGSPSLLTTTHMATAIGGAHHSLSLDLANNVWAWGDNGVGELGDGTLVSKNNPVKITVDSLGNPFTNIVKVVVGGNSGGWLSGALKADGTVWVWGSTTDGIRGNGTNGGQTKRPVQIPFPAGVVIKDVIISEVCVALATNGDVYTWGASVVGGGFWTPYLLSQGSSTPHPYTPTKITLPLPATMISGGAGFYALLNNGHLYGWAYDLRNIGITGHDMSNYGWSPTDITSVLGLIPGTIDTIVTNSMSTIVLRNDSTLWAWGDNSCANMGNGPGLDFRHYRSGNSPTGTPSQWGWDQGSMEAPQLTAVQISPGKHNFTKLFAAASYCFEWWAEDAHDSLYTWGRNKYQVSNGFISEIDSTAEVIMAYYANNLDENYIRFVDPWRTTKIVRATARICKDSSGAQYCSTWPWDGSKPGPTVNPGSNQTITSTWTMLRGSNVIATGVSGRLNSLWTCVGKPAGAADPMIPIRSSDTTAVSNLTTSGTYTFKYWVEDANFKTDSSTMTVTVFLGGTTPPAVSAGSNVTIVLPTNTVALVGSASGNGSAITSTTWTQTSGPNSVTIGSPGSLSTTVSGLVSGTYTFQLSATDSNGQTNSASVTVVVAAIVGMGERDFLPLHRYHIKRV